MYQVSLLVCSKEQSHPSSQPPCCSWTLGSLPGPSFSILLLFLLSLSFTVCLWIFIQKPASGNLPRFSFHHPTHPAHFPCLTFFFFLEDNFFMVLCWFLLYIEVNQAYGHIYPLPLDSHLIPALWVITDPRGELPVL